MQQSERELNKYLNIFNIIIYLVMFLSNIVKISQN